jgi:hypothetical protein
MKSETTLTKLDCSTLRGHFVKKLFAATDTQSTNEWISVVAQFEVELTALSRKFGIGITGSPVLFVMEPDDFERKYLSDEGSRLHFS